TWRPPRSTPLPYTTLFRSGSPVQIVLGGSDYVELARWRDIIIEKAQENPGLSNLDSDFYSRKPQLDVSIDRNRAADLGVSLTVRSEEHTSELQSRENLVCR